MTTLNSIEIPARDLLACELRLFALLNASYTAVGFARVPKSDVHKCILGHIEDLKPVLNARGLEIKPIQCEANNDN